MFKAIHLYVSSSAELYVEREVVGQVVAGYPLTLGWQIDHTPLPGQVSTDHVDRVLDCDVYVIILGQDFSAPMGAELRQARQKGVSPLAYRKRCARSPSSLDALRSVPIEWRSFATPEGFRALLRRDLLQALLQQATQLGLDLDELERLLDLAQDEVERVREKADGTGSRREAGHSGVILGREVWEVEP
jgi:hypothetical protein